MNSTPELEAEKKKSKSIAQDPEICLLIARIFAFVLARAISNLLLHTPQDFEFLKIDNAEKERVRHPEDCFTGSMPAPIDMRP